MKFQQDRAWLEIALDKIEENYKIISRDIGEGCQIMAVLKADAYGLGAVPLGQLLEGLGCPIFAVACIEEAMALREGGITVPILTLGPVLPEHVGIAIDNNIISPIIDLMHAMALSDAALEHGGALKCHLKVDSGMGRFGLVLEGQMDRALADAVTAWKLPGLVVDGIFTHYTGADLPIGDDFNHHQIDLFDDFCAAMKALGFQFKRHSASSYFTSIYPECHNDYVRVASLLFGLEPPAPRGTLCLPSTSLKSLIYQLKTLEAGMPVSYGPTYHTLRRTRVAVVPIGYADGIRRSLQNRASLLVRGQWAPIIGKICMDYLMLDVTDIPEVCEGDEVVLIGQSGDVHFEAWQLAQVYAATVGEVTTAFPARIPRFYTRNGKITGRLD